MLQLVLKFSLVVILFVIAFFVFNTKNNLEATTNSYLPDEQQLYTGLDYLNNIRREVGLKAFERVSTLDDSAKNHTLYLKEQNIISHDETNTKSKFFTGATPAQRALATGHSTNFIGENISSKHLSIEDSIDGLLSAIYHRFGFLNFGFDQIGYFHDHAFYVFNLSNSLISSLCQKGDSIGMEYITEICREKRRAISKRNFDIATKPKLPKFITFPTSTIKTLAVFAAEDPDPLPGCEITSSPVSIEFNPNSNAKLLSFKIFKDNQELKDTILLSKSNDVNYKFNDKQFAIFSKQPFDFGAKYKASIEYIQDNKQDKIEWEFTTKTPKFEYFVVKDGDIIQMQSGKTYEVFFSPKDCNDVFNEYTYKKPFGASVQIKDSGANMLRITPTGLDGNVINFKSNTHNINIIIKNQEQTSIYLILAAIGLCAVVILVFLIFSRKKKI